MRFLAARRAAVSVTIACGIAGAMITAGPAAQAARPAAGRVVLVNCAGQGVVRPARYVIACGDGNDFLKGLTWAFWNTLANGGGKDVINNCNPSCVGGTFHAYPVRVELWRVRNWPHHAGKRYFTRMTLTYTRKVPKGLHRKRVIPLVP